ncbi:50S ribosomal protein L18 [Orientia tsutsugamushi]|uniref:Large ribosomal subunit protein uL18 n=1 Tax=Orientia tsutsugamushi TaxID=784 RepID=A0A2U3RPA0_ORITS|nr:50S ribosomal protein L18 [Orientia tsutsugamushi]KJV56818.1 ribosomal protein L18 [Orientia tsutsugamushi str. Karp]SPR15020.1 50S ribosomal protein L18 [Orientia tsutsugamushi]
MRDSKDRFIIRKNRVRAKIAKLSGGGYPRLSVFKSNRHIYAQVIENIGSNKSNTIAAASTLDRDIFTELKYYKCNIQYAKKVGQLLAERANNKGITSVVFDRGGYKYHGVIKALADGAREKLNF